MVYIGEIVNTHGIKGELKVISDFKYKKNVFKKGQKVYLGKRQHEAVINSYRVHQKFDLITLDGITDINDAIVFKGDEVYVTRDSLEIDGYVDEDIIGLTAYDNDKIIGVVDSIIKNKQEILLIKNNDKSYMVPNVSEFVDVDLKNNRVNINVIEGLLDEN